MHAKLTIATEIEIRCLSDLPKLKILMESSGMKINKSQLARELNVDRRTVDKYLKGYVPKKKRNRSSKIDPYYEVIAELLSEESKQVFYYKRVLWQYLKDHHGLQCSSSAFRAYIARKPEFQAYFTEGKRTKTNKPVVRYETAPGKQAQFDWKENIRYVTKEGEVLSVQVGVFLLSYSRFRTFLLTLSRTQGMLMDFLAQTFEIIGGVPKTILFDNMKTVMDEARTTYSKGVVNERFDQFAKDYGFDIHPCIAGRPRTKGKVETTMKLIDEIHAYQGKLSYEELQDFIQSLCERINHSYHQGTGKIPILAFQQEKNLLLPLPRKEIRDSYKIKHIPVKVNSAGMISYKGNQYSVPMDYQGKTVNVQVYDERMYVYYNTKLIAEHPVSSLKMNYKEEHYIQALSQDLPHYPDVGELAKKNLLAIHEVYKNE
ncbi:IS21 family transposase [[Anoxybacillus] calidus]|nr:IS21 family transposase [Anoxybacillus calidus]